MSKSQNFTTYVYEVHKTNSFDVTMSIMKSHIKMNKITQNIFGHLRGLVTIIFDLNINLIVSGPHNVKFDVWHLCYDQSSNWESTI